MKKVPYRKSGNDCSHLICDTIKSQKKPWIYFSTSHGQLIDKSRRISISQNFDDLSHFRFFVDFRFTSSGLDRQLLLGGQRPDWRRRYGRRVVYSITWFYLSPNSHLLRYYKQICQLIFIPIIRNVDIMRMCMLIKITFMK